MRRITSLLGAVALTALSLAGCYEGADGRHYLSEKSRREAELKYSKKEAKLGYFSRVPTFNSSSSIMLCPGDFNEDGHLDIVVSSNAGDGGRLYFFEGDGRGNFKLKTYSK